tara:strand:+ start:104 stop:616 length:513 start_codon:yes stop_codon:yes gene_type:complete
MRVCPDCGAEYRTGFLECGDCKVALIEPNTSPAMVMAQKESPKAILEKVETTPIVEASLDACREIERELLEHQITAYVAGVTTDDAALGSANVSRFSVVIAAEDLAKASELLKGRFEALAAQEGIGSLNAEPIDLSNEIITCPACGHQGALVEGACEDCGLFLGAPDMGI